MARFVQKAAIITGSSHGIGQATAVLLASEGASVTIHGRSEEGLKNTEKLILQKGIVPEKILSIQGDIQNEQTLNDLVEKTVENFGQIDILVNNAGVVGLPGDFDSMEAYGYIHDINIKSIIKLNQMVEPYLEKAKGNIVNVSSIAAMRPRPTRVFYAMSKAALDHYMRSRTHELAKKGIRINNLNPGMVKTNILNSMGVPEEKQDAFHKQYESRIPLGRCASADEMAKVIGFLASDDASYVTGVALLADGGCAQFADV